MDPMVESTLDWTVMSLTDLAEVAELGEACAYIDDPVDRLSEPQLRDEFAHPWSDIERNAVIGRDHLSGAILAAGWLLIRHDDQAHPRLWCDWLVHPQARHRQIGQRLVGWLSDRAIEWGTEQGASDLWVGSYVDAKLQLRRDNLARNGFEPERWFTDMHVSFDEIDPRTITVEDSEGITVEPFDLERHAEPVRLAHNASFSTLPGAQLVSAQDWQHSLASGHARPHWSFVALEGDQVIGYALSSAYEQDWEPQGWSEGWTDRVGVVPSHRGRGIGASLLRRVLIAFADAGLDGGGLGVDIGGEAGTGQDQHSAAVRLFARLGYREADSVVLYRRRYRYDDRVLRDEVHTREGDQ